MIKQMLVGIVALLALAGGCALLNHRADDSETASSIAPQATEPIVSTSVEEAQNYRYSQLLSRDAIRPVYAPEFISASAATLGDDELVLAIELEGEAKAYPISVLNRREMVNDELAGIPILATW